MFSIVDGTELYREISSEIVKSQAVKLAIAFWGGGAIEKLGLTEHHDIVVVCNLEMGGTNPDEITKLLNIGAKVYSHPTLHAKMGIVGSLGFVGSSNASANGLGLHGTETRVWEELNTTFRNPNDIEDLQTRFEKYVGSADEVPLQVDDIRLEKAKQRWQRRRKELQTNIPKFHMPKNVWDALGSESEIFDLNDAYLVMYPSLVGEEAKKLNNAIEELHEERGNDDYDLYCEWPDLPQNVPLLDCEFEANGLNINGVWMRDSSLPEHRNEAYQICIRQESLLGLDLGNQTKLKRAIKLFWEKNVSDKTDGHCIPMQEFAYFVAAEKL